MDRVGVNLDAGGLPLVAAEQTEERCVVSIQTRSIGSDQDGLALDPFSELGDVTALGGGDKVHQRNPGDGVRRKSKVNEDGAVPDHRNFFALKDKTAVLQLHISAQVLLGYSQSQGSGRFAGLCVRLRKHLLG